MSRAISYPSSNIKICKHDDENDGTFSSEDIALDNKMVEAKITYLKLSGKHIIWIAQMQKKKQCGTRQEYYQKKQAVEEYKDLFCVYIIILLPSREGLLNFSSCSCQRT